MEENRVIVLLQIDPRFPENQVAVQRVAFIVIKLLDQRYVDLFIILQKRQHFR